jgi:bacterioferritin-associated ferredoxin
MYVCICNAVSDSDISRAIDGGAVTLDQLRDRLNVAAGCGHCSVYIEDHLEMRLEQALNHMEPHSA